MDALDELEKRAEDLLTLLGALREENGRMKTALLALAREKTRIEEELSLSREEIAREKKLREEALRRVESLLRKIREHDSVG